MDIYKKDTGALKEVVLKAIKDVVVVVVIVGGIIVTGSQDPVKRKHRRPQGDFSFPSSPRRSDRSLNKITVPLINLPNFIITLGKVFATDSWNKILWVNGTHSNIGIKFRISFPLRRRGRKKVKFQHLFKENLPQITSASPPPTTKTPINSNPLEPLVMMKILTWRAFIFAIIIFFIVDFILIDC